MISLTCHKDGRLNVVGKHGRDRKLLNSYIYSIHHHYGVHLSFVGIVYKINKYWDEHAYMAFVLITTSSA